MIRILIADDHRIVREGLKQILSETTDMSVTAEANNGQETLARLAEQAVDVIMLDISMPGRNGLDILKQIREDYPKIPVLMLSMYSEEQYAIRALRAGASGYMTKDSAPDDLIEAIRKIHLGKKYVSPSLAEKMAFYLDEKNEKPLHESLSDREYQVLCMIASGRTVKEIGAELNLSVKTISTYRCRILEKMGMSSSAALTHYAINNKLVE